MNSTFLRSMTIAIMTLFVDQITKWQALSHLHLGVPEPVFPFLNWLLLFNPGAAFSFLAQGSGGERTALGAERYWQEHRGASLAASD